MLVAMGWTKKESIYGRLARAFKYRFSVFFFFFLIHVVEKKIQKYM